jgi:hypothetical protein
MKDKILYTILGALLLFNGSCTDLEEEVLDESLTGIGLAEAVSGAIAPAYGQVSWVWRHTNYFGLQEIASDEAILPFRGGVDWFDGGKFLATHTHSMTPTNDLVGSAWNELTKNISRTLSAIEVRGLVFQKESSAELSVVLRGQDAIDYIESELLSVVDVINTTRAPGRMTQAAVWGFLARLHLNAAVYRDPYGTPNFTAADMDNVIKYTDMLIGSGQFSLSPEYFDLFSDDNNSNPELIWASDQRGVLRRAHSRWTYWSLPGSNWGRPEFRSSDGTDGPGMTPDFYQTWVDVYGAVDPADADNRFFWKRQQIPPELEDLTGLTPLNDADHYYCETAENYEFNRGIMRGIIWGPRKDSNGAFFTCDDGYRIYPVKQIKGNGPDKNVGYVNLTPQIDFTNEGRLHHTGYRYSKYGFSRTSPNANNFSSIDLVFMRLAEIYMMRAEAKLRKGDASGALADVNMVRTSRTSREPIPAALNSIDIDRLYAEYGFEFYWEGLRRTNQIRFGRYEDSWTEKTDSDPHKRLFPIPQNAVDGASNNEGYLVQNSGY